MTARTAPRRTARPSSGSAAVAALSRTLTCAGLARSLGASEAMVRAIGKGERVPGAELRAKLLELHQVPAAAWPVAGAPSRDVEPSGPPAPSPPPSRGSTRRPALGQPVATSTASLAVPGLSNRERLAAIVVQLEEQIAGCDSDVPRNHVAALYGQLQAAVHKLSRLDGDGELTVAAILKSRAWATIEATLLEVLGRHPRVAAELVVALDGLRATPASSPGTASRPT